jgi:hypothetical protein
LECFDGVESFDCLCTIRRGDADLTWTTQAFNFTMVQKFLDAQMTFHNGTPSLSFSPLGAILHLAQTQLQS